MNKKSPYYNPDAPPHIDRSIRSAERKLEALHLRKQIHAIDGQLHALKSLRYPTHKADEEKLPCALHTAASLIRSIP